MWLCMQLAGVASFVAVGLARPQDLAAGTVFSSLVLFQIMRFPLLTLSTGLVEVRRVAAGVCVCGGGAAGSEECLQQPSA